MVEIQKYDFSIKTITPVHIGTGDVFMSSEYFLDTIEKNGKSYRVFRRINLNKYFNSLDEFNQNKFSKNLLNPKFKLPKISTEYQRYYAHNKCSSRPNPGNEIHENIKVLDKPYIPGSSIKGAFENAILFKALSFDDVEKICSGRYLNENIIKRFFSPSGNPQENIMRFLQVSDSTSSFRPYIYDFQTIKVNKNQPPKDQMKLFYETIVAKELNSSITLNYDSKIFEKLNLEDKSYLIDRDYIKLSLYEFAKEYIENEIEFSKRYGIKKSIDFYKILKKKNSKNTPLLRIGSTKGLFASTIDLKIKQFGFDYFKKVKNNIRGRKAKWEYPVTRIVVKSSRHPTGWTQLNFKGE